MAGPFSYAIAIEGVGSSTGAANTNGIAWYTGAGLSAAQKSASTYEWIGGPGSHEGLILPESLQFDTSVNPFTADVRGASATFEVGYSDTAAQLLIYQQVSTTIAVSSAITAASTSLVLTGTGSTGLTGVVWIFDEAILLGTESPSGTYDVTSGRGYFSTTAAAASAGANVYTAIPHHVGRWVKFIEFDHSDDSETVVAAGFLDESVQTSGDGTKIRLPIREIWSLLGGAKINRGAPNLVRLSTLAARYFQDEDQIKFVGRIQHELSPKRVAKASDADHPQAYQIGEALAFGYYDDDAVGGIDATQFLDNGKISEYIGGPVENARTSGVGSAFHIRGQERQPGPVYEVFAIWRDLGSGYAPTRDLTYPFHPVEIAMALLTSTASTTVATSTTQWDCLGRAWGLGMPTAWFDTSDISTQVAATAGQKVDRLILGWDGEPVDVWDAVKRLLVAYGWFPCITSTGLVTFRQMRQAHVGDVAGASSVTLLPHQLEWLPSRAETVDIINARVGATPWDDGYTIEAVARDYATGEPQDSLRAAIFAQAKEVDYDLSTYANTDDILQTLISEVIIRHLAMPRFRCNAPNGTYDIGDFLQISTPGIVKLPERNGWFVDSTGAMTATTTGVTSFLGLVIGRRYMQRTRTYQLTMLLTNYRTNEFARWIAPSGEVSSYSAGGPTITLANTAFTSDDAAQFTDGDRLIAWKPDGTPRNPTPDIGEISGTPSGGVITLKAAFSVAPQAGDIIELAYLNDSVGYPYAGNSSGPLASYRAWAFFAEGDGTLGGDEVDADIYDYRRY